MVSDLNIHVKGALCKTLELMCNSEMVVYFMLVLMMVNIKRTEA